MGGDGVASPLSDQTSKTPAATSASAKAMTWPAGPSRFYLVPIAEGRQTALGYPDSSIAGGTRSPDLRHVDGTDHVGEICPIPAPPTCGCARRGNHSRRSCGQLFPGLVAAAVRPTPEAAPPGQRASGYDYRHEDGSGDRGGKLSRQRRCERYPGAR